MCSGKFGTTSQPFSRLDRVIGSTSGETFSQYIDRSIGLKYFRPPEKKPKEEKSIKYRV